MTAVELVRQEVIERLRRSGLDAQAAYSRAWAKEQTEVLVTVGVRRLESGESGFSCYLGERYDPDRGCWEEEYGQAVILEIALDAYSPRSIGAEGCARAMEQAHDALMYCEERVFSGKTLVWSEVRWDRESGMFLQQGTLRCGAYFVAAVEEESGLLLDFKLKGAVNGEHDSA